MKYIPENAGLLAHEIAEGGILSAAISCPAGAEFEKIRIRPVVLKSGGAFQFEQFRGPKAFHRNVSPADLETELARVFATGVTGAEFSLASGMTRAIRLLANRHGAVTVLRKGAPKEASPSDGSCMPASGNPPENGTATPFAAAQAHDRQKKYLLEEGTPVPFLVDLGVMAENGAVIKSKYDKFRQVNRFLEFIDDVMPELEAEIAEDARPNAEPATGRFKRELTVVDFGCGKSYLTFAVYHYLSEIRHIPVRIIGLDLKEDVIAECSRLALRYGYEKLAFTVGDIADYTGCERADLVITLHACDTATDYALAQAVRWNARVILSVPCCQHELNAQLGISCGAVPLAAARGTDGEAPGPTAGGVLAASAGEPPAAKACGREVLKPAFRHGIIRERMAALFTDALRAELLETAGYRVQILEFIDMAHTPKNLLIRAIRGGRDAARETGGAGKRQKEYERLRDFLGADPTLEKILGKGNGK